MEHLEFDFSGSGKQPASSARRRVLVGVVSSGNLEVLLEHAPLAGGCRVVVDTSAVGFGEVWRAVLADFVQRHQPRDMLVSINDAGATPAVVSLRLDQAFEEFRGPGA